MRRGSLSVVRSASSALFPFLCSTPQFSLLKKKKNKFCPKALCSVLSWRWRCPGCICSCDAGCCAALQLGDVCVAAGMPRDKHRDTTGIRGHMQEAGIFVCNAWPCSWLVLQRKRTKAKKEVKKALVITKDSIKAGESKADFASRCREAGDQGRTRSC